MYYSCASYEIHMPRDTKDGKVSFVNNHWKVWDHAKRYRRISEVNEYGYVLAVRDERCRARRQTPVDMAYGSYVQTIPVAEPEQWWWRHRDGLFIQNHHLSGLLYTEGFTSTSYYLPNPHAVRPVPHAAFPGSILVSPEEEVTHA